MIQTPRLCTPLRRLFLLALVAFSGCSSSQPEQGDDSAATRRVAIQLNWFPEAEHGGVYAASIEGLYAERGLDVEIRPGGLMSTIAPDLELGRVQFAITNAEDVVLFRQQGADIVALLAAAQIHPRCIMVRADSGVESFSDLAGMTLQCGLGRPYLAYLQHRGLLENVTLVPYQNSVAPLAASSKIAQQAYVFAEPLTAEQAGIEVRTLLVADLGFNPYSSVLVTTGDLVREQPELVADVVAATREGWRRYLEAPQRTNKAILAANEHGMTIEALDYGVAKLRELCLPDGMPPEQFGTMTAERWQTLVDQMIEIGLASEEKVKAEECWTGEFVERS